MNGSLRTARDQDLSLICHSQLSNQHESGDLQKIQSSTPVWFDYIIILPRPAAYGFFYIKKIDRREAIMASNKKRKLQNPTDSKETNEERQLKYDIIREILRLLPTKSSVLMSFLSKQWQSAWFALPAIHLDFDEEGEPLHDNNDDDNHIGRQHAKFINMFSWFVGFREKDKQQQQQLVEKFRIRMVRYSLLEDEATVVDKWLTFGLERSVKELDISLLGGGGKAGYTLPQTLFTSKSLTTLKLEHVTVNIDRHGNPVSLPSLKTVTLKTVCFNGYSSFRGFISSSDGDLSPSIENLSIVSCSDVGTDMFWNISIYSSTLKSLEVIDCNCRTISASAGDLESITIVSDYADFKLLNLYGCSKVNYMDIRARHLGTFNVAEFSQSVKEATLDVPNRCTCLYDCKLHDQRYILSRISAKLV
ncbi:hypothetical protein ACFXTN_030632 [Malus domestica]